MSYAVIGASLALMILVRARVFAGEPWPLRRFLDIPILGAGFWAACFTVIKTTGLDLSLLVFPLRLFSDRSFNAIPIAHVTYIGSRLSLVVIAALIAIAVIRYLRKDRVIFWSLGFAIALLPASNRGAAERFLYLPSIASRSRLPLCSSDCETAALPASFRP